MQQNPMTQKRMHNKLNAIRMGQTYIDFRLLAYVTPLNAPSRNQGDDAFFSCYQGKHLLDSRASKSRQIILEATIKVSTGALEREKKKLTAGVKQNHANRLPQYQGLILFSVRYVAYFDSWKKKKKKHSLEASSRQRTHVSSTANMVSRFRLFHRSYVDAAPRLLFFRCYACQKCHSALREWPATFSHSVQAHVQKAVPHTSEENPL